MTMTCNLFFLQTTADVMTKLNLHAMRINNGAEQCAFPKNGCVMVTQIVLMVLMRTPQCCTVLHQKIVAIMNSGVTTDDASVRWVRLCSTYVCNFTNEYHFYWTSQHGHAAPLGLAGSSLLQAVLLGRFPRTSLLSLALALSLPGNSLQIQADIGFAHVASGVLPAQCFHLQEVQSFPCWTLFLVTCGVLVSSTEVSSSCWLDLSAKGCI